MARKKTGKAEQKTEDKEPLGFGDWQFVNHTMTRDEKDSFRQWDLDGETLAQMIDRMIDGNYKLTLGYDDYNKCNTASIACRDEENDDYGLILTGRASSAFDALRVVLYKHFVLLTAGWYTWQQKEASDDILG